MSSKLRLLSSLILAASALGLSACDYFLAERPSQKDPAIELQAQELQCLKEVPAKVKSWLVDESTNAQIETGFTCLRDTLVHFQKFTRGKTRPDYYSSDELRSFFNEILASEMQITESFMVEILKFKTLALGGSPDGMTVAELQAAEKLLSVLKATALDLKGNLRYLLFQGAREDAAAFEKARSAQSRLSEHILKIVQMNPTGNPEYAFQDFARLVQEFDRYLGSTRVLSQFLKWFPFSRAMKDVFVGDVPELKTGKQWSEYVLWGVRAYGMALDFFYRVKPLKFETPQEWETLIAWVDSVLDWVDISPALNQRGALSVASVNEVLKEASQSEIFPAGMNADLLVASACRAILNFVEGPAGHRKDCYEFQEINWSHYRFIKYEWNVWRLSQRQLNKAFAQKSSLSWGEYLEELKDFQPEEAMGILSRDRMRSEDSKAVLGSFSEWRSLQERGLPSAWGPEGRILIQKLTPATVIGFEGMTMANHLRSASRLILRGYGQGRGTDVFRYSLTEEAFRSLESDFRSVGEKLQVLDPRSESSASRTFNEANYLTFSGNGDGALSGQELFEVLNVMTSGGGLMARSLYKDAFNSGCGRTEMDSGFGRPLLDQDCFWKVFNGSFGARFKSVPGLVALKKKLSADRWNEMLKDLLALARIPGVREKDIEFGEIRVLLVALLYAETLRVTFDADQNLALNEAEVRRAAPRFRSIVSQHSPLGTVATDSIFTCMVFGQKKPGFDWNSAGCVGNNIFGYSTVTTADLVKVLSVLKADLVK